MLSLILPYYERQAATDAALALIAEHYRDMSLEIIIVDDGSPEPFKLGSCPLNIKVFRLPEKSYPLNPCTPYNAGVSISTGEYLALSNPEILHKKPVLQRMLAKLREEGESAYVMAACWCEEQKRWHAHSSKRRSDSVDVGSYIPEGADYHFMTMLHRKLWSKARGFDDDYREGAGYDDPDFVRRLHRAEARFFMCDDLVVQHPRRGARAKWTAAMNGRNRAIFMSKWQPLR